MGFIKKIIIFIGIVFLIFIFLSIVADEEKRVEENGNNGSETELNINDENGIEVGETPSAEEGGNFPIFSGNFKKFGGNPVIPTQSSFFNWPGDPFVIKDGSTYKMWFGANVKDSVTNVGYATSNDGKTWSIHPSPVLQIGAPGTWDDFSVETPSVIKDGSTYKMWYTGAGEAPGPDATFDALHKIGYATSPDGINWTKHPTIVMDVDIEDPADWDNFDFAGKADPMVIKEGSIYKMWYSAAKGGGGEGFIISIGYAESPDGINWVRRPNPVLARAGSGWDAGSRLTPAVVKTDAGYAMLYTGVAVPGDIPSSGDIGCATSTDGITWIPMGTTPCIAKGGGHDNGGVWGPTVLAEGDTFKVWYSAVRLAEDISVSIGVATQE